MKNVTAVILAAGKGTRMKSDLPKVLTLLANKPLIYYVLESAVASGINRLIIVVGYKKDSVIEAIKTWQTTASPEIEIIFSEQKEQKGTGHALMMAQEHFEKKKTDIIILLGDVPFIKNDTITNAMQKLHQSNSNGLVISMMVDEPMGYGRILRDDNNNIEAIIEEKDATDKQREICEVNSGIFAFDGTSIWPSLHKISSDNSQNEYYLTDMVKIFNHENKVFSAWICEDAKQLTGINSNDQLRKLEAVAK